MKKIYLEHISILIITFLILDLVSTAIGLHFGITEAGIFAKNFDFVGIIMMKFIAFFILLGLYFIMIKKYGYNITNKVLYYIAGIYGGIFISNLHQIIYILNK